MTRTTKDNIGQLIEKNRDVLTRLGGRCPECGRLVTDDEGFLCWRCDPNYGLEKCTRCTIVDAPDSPVLATDFGVVCQICFQELTRIDQP